MATTEDDPSMARIRAWWTEHREEFTLQELGVKMGFEPTTARQAVYQFLQGKDPRISTLRRFATASEIPIDELVTGIPKTKKRSKVA